MEGVYILDFTQNRDNGLWTGQDKLLDPCWEYEIFYYESQWGKEFQKRSYIWSGGREFSVRVKEGRSSHGFSPFFRIGSRHGHILFFMVFWSGNWQVSIDREGNFRALIPGGKNIKFLKAQEFPKVYIFSSRKGDWDHLTAKMYAYGREHIYPRVPALPVEWNPWWTFEDALINESVFLENACAAKEMGIELCTLDAGWYGNNKDIHWSCQQGDWDTVSGDRFPHGLGFLSEQIHKMGMSFGLWVEPEALGRDSQAIKDHPEFEAVSSLGPYENPYLCLADSRAARWLFNVLCRLIDMVSCDWLKLDFNMDPKDGCCRTDHGHGEKDGLFWHYQAYYDILKKLRKKYPELILENCSSGGLRCDGALFSLTHVTFLSDVDETSHSLDSFYELSRFVPPEHILHWAWSQTRTYEDGSHAFEGYEIHEDTPEDEIRYTLRAAMLHGMGISRDLTAMAQRTRQIFKAEIYFYKALIRPFLFHSVICHLLNENGCMALQYISGNQQHSFKEEETGCQNRHLVFVFCKKEFSDGAVKICLKHLEYNTVYRIQSRDAVELSGDSLRTGADLMERGLVFQGYKMRAFIFQIDVECSVF